MKTALLILLFMVCGEGSSQSLSQHFRSDTTKFYMILYVENNVMRVDSGFLVRNGWGNEYIAGFFFEAPENRWFLFKKVPNAKCECYIELKREQIYDAR